MCGIAGVRAGGTSRIALEELVGRMTERLVHRGPDSGGVWLDATAGVALGHRRLAIIDRSPAGHQPMISHCGRYVITYNGELYNYKELRSALDIAPAAATSDTSVLLACISAWGLEAALARANGMFAFALWDRRTRTLSLVSDRLGEKPLYYATLGGDVVFASELKALYEHPAFTGHIDEEARALYLRRGYVPAPRTIYRGVWKLQPGRIATYASAAAVPDVRCYWSPPPPDCAPSRQYADPKDAVAALDELLGDSVRLRLRADVPVGVLFSGGLDSTAVLARARRHCSNRLTACTVAFDELRYDEARHARRVAKHLECDYTEVVLTSHEALSIIPTLPDIFDEPFGDASGVAAHLLAKLTKQHVTVALTGDGGDELFCGYLRYRWAAGLWPLWRGRASAFRMPAWYLVTAAGRIAEALTRIPGGSARLTGRLRRLSQCLAARNVNALYEQLTAQSDVAGFLVERCGDPRPSPLMEAATREEMLRQLMWLDATDYLPNDILVKLDRASMAVALEARLPFLDFRLVEWAAALPGKFLLRRGGGKWIVRQLLERDLPSRLWARPKRGFSLPLGDWLRGPLRDWADDLLRPHRLRECGFADAVVRARWEEHLSRRRDWRHSLWTTLTLLAWHRSERDTRVGARARGFRATSYLVACADS